MLVQASRRRLGSACDGKGRQVAARAAPPTAAAWIEQNMPEVGTVVGEQFMGGSSWSSAYVYNTSNARQLFVKTSLGRDDSMFRGEALGLQAMADAQAVRVPEVFHYGPLPGRGQHGSFICMEYLQLGGKYAQADLGRRMAQMHLAAPKDPEAAKGRFGFAVDNTIGGTSQPNGWMDNWIEFFRERRLQHQLQLAGDSRLSRLGDKLLPILDRFFDDIGDVRPSILHGDLWSGNIAAYNGEPVIFDPACYFGHHEAEWGMSWCAGFRPEFWRAYHELIPKAKGWEDRHQLYTLYHILNHYNLFGDSYYGQAASIMEDLVRKKA